MNLIWRVAMAGFLHVLLFVGAVELYPAPFAGGIEPDAALLFLALLVLGGVHSLAVAVLVGTSAARGVSLLAVIALLFFGLHVLAPFVEMAGLAVPAAPEGTAEAQLLWATVQAVGWLPPTVWLMSRWAGQRAEQHRSGLPSYAWARLLGLGVLYVVLEAVAQIAAAQQAPEVVDHLVASATSPMGVGLLLAKGLILTLLAWPVLLTLGGGWVGRGLALAVALIAFDAARFGVPSPLVADDARWPMLVVHGVVAGMFGLLMALVLRSPATPPAGDDTTVAQPSVKARRSGATPPPGDAEPSEG